MIPSDRSIIEEIRAGRIEIDPFDDGCAQRSSVDLHVDRERKDRGRRGPTLGRFLEEFAGRMGTPADQRPR